MRNLIVALLCLFSASSAFANVETNRNSLALIKKIELKQKRMKKQLRVSQSLIKILQPATIRQGEAFSLYFQSNTEVTGTNSLIDLSIDGLPVENMEQPAKGLFIYHSNGESEVKTHNAIARLSIEDAAESKSLRDAIQQLDLEIAILQDQIDEMEPGEEQDALIQQRNEKQGIKSQLIAALAAIKTPIGEEAFTFRIIAALGNNPNFFRILSVSPSFGPVEGGTELTITGQRFPTGMEAVLGGVTVPVTFVSAAQVKITSPDFTTGANGGVGIKSLELRLPAANPGDPVKNATRSNVFYAANIETPPVENVKPVAVAGIAQSVSVGTEVTMNGSASYDNNPGTSLAFSWRAISVPAGSGISTGVVHSTAESFTFTPSKPGAYVWELVTSDGELDSEPSLTVVTANPPANSAPVPTADGSFSLGVEQSGSVQISHGDVDDYQAHSYRVIKQSAFGTASVSSTGLVSFEAGNAAGGDFIEVLVMDNGNPPLSGVVSIPVEVVASVVTLDDLYYEVRARDGLITVEFGADTLSSSNGQITSVVWNFGDGTSQPSLNPADGGFVDHDYLAANAYTVTATATDSLGASASQSMNITIGTSAMPVLKLTSDVISGSVPLTVNFDTSGSSDDVGISVFRWRFGDGSSQQNTTSNTISHTFNNEGVYRVRVRARDADQNWVVAFMDIYAGVTPPAEGSKPWGVMNVGSREVVLTNAHSFSGANSIDPNPSSPGIAAYRWNFSDYLTCDWNHATPGCVATGATTNYTFPAARSYGVSLEVEGALGATNADALTYKEVYAVNAGHAPRAVALASVGSNPLEVNFNGASSFDYDGTIVSYSWNFNDPGCTTGCTSSSANPTYTYSVADMFWPTLTVVDSDGNSHEAFVAVDLSSSIEAKKAKKKSALDHDSERERMRQQYVRLCVVNRHGRSCFEAGKMYQEDGNSIAAGKYFAKACEYGYEAACSRK